MPGPETAGPQPEKVGSEYEDLLNPNLPNPSGNVEDAAVRPEKSVESRRVEPSPEEQQKIDAALRERVPQPPLTDEQINTLTAMRGGERPTDKDIKSINEDRQAGIWLGPF